eukprot:TRINITY_DN24086_c0_g1_i1.p1 TRINITY_DN24086_c0_g1~~TRINITY_DN24086_c0_g1_i1.p1  ORF type:complete len:138 (-),score=12.76 TRINITY_DN24086_c0_g1_i1:118-504(-)
MEKFDELLKSVESLKQGYSSGKITPREADKQFLKTRHLLEEIQLQATENKEDLLPEWATTLSQEFKSFTVNVNTKLDRLEKKISGIDRFIKRTNHEAYVLNQMASHAKSPLHVIVASNTEPPMPFPKT